MVKIKKQIVSDSVINKRSYGYGNPVTSITIHQTGNKDKGANAQMHANLQSNLNPRLASWQYQVDDKEAIQSFPDEVQCWAATDGKGPGNTTSLHIEICINEDGNYKKAVQNAAELVKVLLKRHKLTINDVKQHRDWYPKNCPEQLREGYQGITWSDFIKMVREADKKMPKQTVKIETGGLSNENLVEVIDFFRKRKWYGEVTINWHEGNPKVLSGGLSPSSRKEFESWLKERGWWYEVKER